MYSEICSQHLTHRWGAVGSHSTVLGDQLQILELSGDTPTVHVLTMAETRAPTENPRRHGENMQTLHRKALPRPGIEPRTFLLWGDSANHYSTMPPLQLSIHFWSSSQTISDEGRHWNDSWMTAEKENIFKVWQLTGNWQEESVSVSDWMETRLSRCGIKEQEKILWLKPGSYFLRLHVRMGPLWYAWHKNHHSPMSVGVRVDPSAYVCMQPKIGDRADCLLWKRINCACSFTCVNKAMFWCNYFYCRYTRRFLILFNIKNNNKKEYNMSYSGKNVLSFMSAEPLFFSPVVTAWMTQI